MKLYKYFLIILIFLSFSAGAFELDTSVDDDIRKNYNPSALEQQLPALPKVAPTSSGSSQTSNTPPKNLPVIDNTKSKSTTVKNLPYNSNIDKSTAIRIKKGTKFKVKSNAYISDTTRIGSTFNFTTLNPVYQKYITIPAGTVFHATITNSHAPQITGNGGLIEVAVDGVEFKGYSYGADGKVTKANHKKIFLNNIKGQRKYFKGIVNQVNKGQKFYNKSRAVSSKLSGNPFGTILSPIPTVFGAGVYTINLIASPVIAVASKGGKISIPAGSEFEIKLLEDVYLQN